MKLKYVQDIYIEETKETIAISKNLICDERLIPGIGFRYYDTLRCPEILKEYYMITYLENKGDYIIVYLEKMYIEKKLTFETLKIKLKENNWNYEKNK